MCPDEIEGLHLRRTHSDRRRRSPGGCPRRCRGCRVPRKRRGRCRSRSLGRKPSRRPEVEQQVLDQVAAAVAGPACGRRTRRLGGNGTGWSGVAPVMRSAVPVTGSDVNHFQIPANPDQPQVFTLSGVPVYPSAGVDENQFEQNYFGVFALQGTIGSELRLPDRAVQPLFDGFVLSGFRRRPDLQRRRFESIP